MQQEFNAFKNVCSNDLAYQNVYAAKVQYIHCFFIQIPIINNQPPSFVSLRVRFFWNYPKRGIVG